MMEKYARDKDGVVEMEKKGGRKLMADKIKYFLGGNSRDILDEAGRG